MHCYVLAENEYITHAVKQQYVLLCTEPNNGYKLLVLL